MKQSSKLKKLLFSVILVVVTVTAMLVVGEVVVRLFSPVEYLYPRYEFSPQYGFTLFANRRMEHAIPGKYKFHYTINKYGYRGEPVELAQEYEYRNLVVLGDSYSFGMGVDDGDEYAQRMAAALAATHRVVNLATPGWGLTQQIRRYYDFGSLYHPDYVVLQFCSNDPEDNFNNMVTRVENGELVFRDSGSSINWTKKYLSDSILQKSQLYNFFRGRVYNLVKNVLVSRKEGRYAQDREAAVEPSGRALGPKEDFYNALLVQFARRLQGEGVRLIVIAVNNQLDRYPGIRDEIARLDSEGLLRYVEVVPWFEGVTDFKSPEGHLWGAKAHAVLADGLVRVIHEMDAQTPVK